MSKSQTKDAGPSPLVSVITVNYNQPEYTLSLLDSLEAITHDIEVIVVDNGSTKDSTPLFKKNYPLNTYLRSEVNLGFAGGNNLGLTKAKGDYIFFINNDALVIDQCISTLVQLFQTIPNLGIVSPLIYFAPESVDQARDIIQFAGTTRLHPITARNKTLGRMKKDHGEYLHPFPIPYVHGAAMMISKKILDEVGPMSEMFFLYYEELDWSERIRKAGYQIYLEPKAKIYHVESVTTGQASPLKTYYLNRNRILFARRHFPQSSLFGFYLFLIFFTIPKNLLIYLSKGQWNHLRAFQKALLWHFKIDNKPHQR